MTPSRALLRLLSICCVAVLHSSFVHAADIDVGASCSLADAITAANMNAAVGGCPAGDGADTISLTGDITLLEALPAIVSDLTIEGNGNTVRGGFGYRIFHVTDGNVTLNRLTLSNGNPTSGPDRSAHGSAILVHGEAALRISGSAITNNATDYGGAIRTEDNASLKISNSTITGNWGYFSGALSVAGQSRAILTHVTIANNAANAIGGIYAWPSATVKLRNSILARNYGGDCGVQKLAENVGNLIGDDSCYAAKSGDPMFGLLEDSPAYFPLQAGSPAINAADPAYCAETDQAGRARPQGHACDIGAYEAVTTIGPTPDQAKECTLADQIIAANTDAPAGLCPAGDGADTIYLGEDVTLDARLPLITSDISIEGEGHIISGDKRFRIFNIDGGALTLRNITLTEGYGVAGGGSAIRMYEGELTISNSVISGNLGAGSAITIQAGEFHIEGSTLQKNRGGAIANSGTGRISDSRLSHNIAGMGGAISNRGTLSVTGSRIEENFAEYTAGAVLNGGSMDINGSVISGNGDGGKWEGASIYQTRGRLSISDSAINDNKADNDESVITKRDGELILNGNNVSDNSPNAGWDGTGSSESEGGSAIPGTVPIGDCGRVSGGGTYWTHPLPNGVKTQGFANDHKGIDLAAPLGTPIVAANGGPISYAGWADYYGIMVAIRHGDLATVYGHMSDLAVKCGDVVSSGQIIGYVGSTGRSSGNHLHFEIRVGGEAQDPLLTKEIGW